MKPQPTSAGGDAPGSTSERSGEVIRAGQLSTEPSLQVPLALQPGHVLAGGRLRLLRLLGRGGSGVVFEAIDAERGERVALKMLAYADPASIYHLKNEFRSIADVRHPNLARIYELLSHEGSWFLMMECVDGVSFDAWVRPDGVLDEPRLRASLAQLTAAVQALHLHGKLHRDLKPSNVLVTRDGRVVVLDFGLAIDASTGVGQTVPGEIGGTPVYMAPEHALGAPASASSDAYAIGVMLYEALVGQPPFAGTLEQIFLAKQRSAVSWPVPAHESPADLKQLCRQLLAAEPALRPSLSDVIAQLQLAAGLVVTAPESAEGLPIIVGRSAELETLRDAFRECLAERAALVAVRGTSGIGKTALCESFLGSLPEAARVMVLRARCYEHENLPFKALDPLIDALGRLIRRLPHSEAGAVLPREVYALTRLFPSLGRIDLIANMPEKPIGDPQELRRRAFGALLEWLTRIRDRQPVVVFIDDLQWACSDSLQALRQMLVERGAPPILVVLAFRDDGAHADMAVSPLMQTARDNPSWSVRELPLTRLSDVASGELAVRLFDGASAQPDAWVVGAISREAGGNPLLVRELARFASRGGSLTQAVSLASVLATHLSELTAAGRELVELVALVGEPLRLELALEASGATLLDVDQLRGARLVRTGTDHKRGGQAQIECYHDRIREELVAGADAGRARTAFARLARVLSRQPDLDHQLLSRCFERAGDRELAAEHALNAAREADRTMAFERAVLLYEKCIELGAHDRTRLQSLTIALGTAQENSGHGSVAADTFLRLAAEARGDLAIDLRRRAAEQWLATGHSEQGITQLRTVCRELGIGLPASAHATLATLAWKQLRQQFTRLDSGAPDPGKLSARNELRLRTARTAVVGLMGYHPLQCSCVASDYLTMAFKLGGVPDRVRALGFNAYLLSQVEPRGKRVEELIRHLNELANQHGGVELTGFANLIMGCHALFSGQPRARQHFAQARSALLESVGVHWELDAVNFHDQYSAFACGDFADIARTAPVLIQEAERRGRVYAAAMLSGFGGIVAWIVPDDAEAYRRQLRELRRRWDGSEDGGWPDFLLLIGEAMLHLYTGDPEAGLSVLEQQQARFTASLLTRRATGLRSHRTYWRLCAASALGAARVSRNALRRASLATALRRELAGARTHGSARAGGRREIVRAALALDDDKPDEACAWLRQAVDLFTAVGSRMHVAAAKRRLGQLLGGRGETLVVEGESVMQGEGVKNIEAMTEFLCPGCR